MIRALVTLRLLPWLRRPTTYPLAAAMPTLQAIVLIAYLASQTQSGIVGPDDKRQVVFVGMVIFAVLFVGVLVPALASGALLREGEDDDIARAASGGATPDALLGGALFAELCRGLLLLWVSMPVLVLGALILRPRHLWLLLLLPHLAMVLGVVCGVLPSILAPTRFSAAALGYVGEISAAIAIAFVATRLGRAPGGVGGLPAALGATLAIALGGIWLSLRVLRWRGLCFR